MVDSFLYGLLFFWEFYVSDNVAVFALLVSLLSLLISSRFNKNIININKRELEINDRKLKLEVDNKLYEVFCLIGGNKKTELIHSFSDVHGLLEAKRIIRDCIVLDPDNSAVYVMRGYVRAALNQMDLAEEDYNYAIKLNSNCSEAYNALGLIFIENGRLEEAEDKIRSAISLSACSSYYFNLGNALVKMDRLHDAEEAYLSAVSFSGFSDPYYLNLGLTLFRNGQSEKALSVLSDAELFNIDNPNFYVAKGVLLSSTGNEHDARDAFIKALQIDPDFKLALRFLGKSFLEKKDYFEAIKYLNKLVSVDSSSAESHFLLAIALLANDEDGMAVYHVQKAIQIDPDNEAYRDALLQFSKVANY